jgi:hypothetical protein
LDNLAHSLAGAALGEAGLKKKTGLGMATLIIAANLPDIDALGLLFGENLAWRRGWTHGPIAMLVLPPLLVGAMVLFDRWQARRGTRPAERLPIHVGWLLALAYVGWASHPLLDFMNTYGIQSSCRSLSGGSTATRFSSSTSGYGRRLVRASTCPGDAGAEDQGILPARRSSASAWRLPTQRRWA